MSMYDRCQTCGEQGTHVLFEDGAVYAYACTSEIVVRGASVFIIKRCPDFGNIKGARPKDTVE